MKRLWRRILVSVFGIPVCLGCQVHIVNCVGWCGLSDMERTKQYLKEGGAK